jgi:hypothetical protein
MSKKVREKKDKHMDGTQPSGFAVICSWCNVVMRSNARDDAEQMCLICHARMLNEYFQTLEKEATRNGGHLAPLPNDFLNSYFLF